MMDWKNWKLIWAVVLIFLLCGEAAPHVEPLLPEYGPTTISTLQVSGANMPNVSAGVYSWNSHPWITS